MWTLSLPKTTLINLQHYKLVRKKHKKNRKKTSFVLSLNRVTNMSAVKFLVNIKGIKQ